MTNVDRSDKLQFNAAYISPFDLYSFPRFSGAVLALIILI